MLYLTILQTNFHTPFGEIDIVAKDKDELVFIEVKTRSNINYGYPFESVSKSKIKKIIKSIQIYDLNHPTFSKKSRIDVVSILLSSTLEVVSYEILRNVYI